VARDAHAELAADRQTWGPLRSQLAGQFFVDLNRLLVSAAP
jgi:hypothetical protein